MRNLKIHLHAILIAAVLICGWTPGALATFYGESETGLQPFASDRYGASYYVPETYDENQDWPLVVVLYSDEGEKGTVYVDKWLSEIKKHNVIALFVSYLNPREMPFSSDKRTTDLLHELKTMYHIDQSRVLLTAFGEAGHYAFYLASHYPEEFSAVATVAGGAEGRYASFLSTPKRDKNSVRYLVLYGTKDERIDQRRFVDAHRELVSRGFQVELEEYENLGHESRPELHARVMEWFESLQAPPKEMGAHEASTGTFDAVPKVVRPVVKG